MATPLDFAKALLNRLGLSQTKNRLVSLVAFAAQEGGHWANGAKYNPFNTMLGLPGSRSVIGGVQAYKDWPQGIEATARTIAQPNMRPMLNALKADADPKTFQHAVTATPWCPQSIPGCSDYAARDPYALYSSWANKQDSTTLVVGSSPTNWPLILTSIAALGAVSAAAFYYKKGRLPFLRRARA